MLSRIYYTSTLYTVKIVLHMQDEYAAEARPSVGPLCFGKAALARGKTASTLQERMPALVRVSLAELLLCAIYSLLLVFISVSAKSAESTAKVEIGQPRGNAAQQQHVTNDSKHTETMYRCAVEVKAPPSDDERSMLFNCHL